MGEWVRDGMDGWADGMDEWVDGMDGWRATATRPDTWAVVVAGPAQLVSCSVGGDQGGLWIGGSVRLGLCAGRI